MPKNLATLPTDTLEQQLRSQHRCAAIAGVDEAGRGHWPARWLPRR
ncbi:MAG: hypothetical protein UZ07_CHB004001691 [Chlorobi bacterium OLB7]|nr:MAG: hypothetical protein UZ07_CHB004001691 [Chlorobi bacterium OLB7]